MISTGIPTLDMRLDGGLPQGAITEVFGPSSSAKTALGMHFIKSAASHNTLYIDSDSDFPDDWADRIGIDRNNLDVFQFGDDNVNFDVLLNLIPSYELVVIDTITNLMAAVVEPYKDIGAALNKYMSKLVWKLSRSDTSLVVLNQVRSSMGKSKYDRTTCGRLLKMYTNYRIQMYEGGFIRAPDNETLGRTVSYKVLKAVGLQPFRKQELSIMYNSGINIVYDSVRLGLQLGILEQGGSWIQWCKEDGTKEVLGQGVGGAALGLADGWSSFSSQLSQAIAEHKQKRITTKPYSIQQHIKELRQQ